MQVQETRPRKNGKTAEHGRVMEIVTQGSKKPHRVTPPMDYATRLEHYQAQNDARCGHASGSKPQLTFAQARRLRKKAGDKPYRAPRQTFQRIDNQHLPTGRVGAFRRFGAPLGRLTLDQLFQRAVVPVTGREVSTEPLPEQAGRKAQRGDTKLRMTVVKRGG